LAFIAPEYEKAAIEARGRSTTPNSGGPILMVLAEEVSWQASHLADVALPAAASA
jgi:hypothetical protein